MAAGLSTAATHPFPVNSRSGRCLSLAAGRTSHPLSRSARPAIPALRISHRVRNPAPPAPGRVRAMNRLWLIIAFIAPHRVLQPRHGIRATERAAAFKPLRLLQSLASRVPIRFEAMTLLHEPVYPASPPGPSTRSPGEPRP